MNSRIVAHIRKIDLCEQSLEDHLQSVAELAGQFMERIGFGKIGKLMGILHDLGKYSKEFQAYIRSATDTLDPDLDEEAVDAASLKGTIDHSTSGAQYLWQKMSLKSNQHRAVCELLAHSIVSHHSGLIDIIKPSGIYQFNLRLSKDLEKTHLTEVIEAADKSIIDEVESIVSENVILDFFALILKVVHQNNRDLGLFHLHLLDKFLFSCLVDADRIDTAEFENPHQKEIRKKVELITWVELEARLEKKYQSFEVKTVVDKLRGEIADSALSAAKRNTGLFSLSVPTGGGKTLASLRFALHHAQLHDMERIIYVLPYTSIIDQNADEVRRIMNSSMDGNTDMIVLEHHSNLTPDKENWWQKIASQNWDAKIIFTTSVQFLESMFDKGTRSARRFHRLARSVIILDEIQNLPVETIHLFNNSVNFLIDQLGSTVMLCTATQPLLDQVDSQYGALPAQTKTEIIPDIQKLFAQLKRVDIIDKQKPEGYKNVEIAEVIQNLIQTNKSLLLIANTKKVAWEIFRILKTDLTKDVALFHLSTNMCPEHRLSVLSSVRQLLNDDVQLICISTQLIEAGVDIDFETVIRLTAGLDSIAQAAGRCNRNGLRKTGKVYVMNSAEENLSSLPQIQLGKMISQQVIREVLNSEHALKFPLGLLDPAAMNRYYDLSFFSQKEKMVYPVGPKSLAGRDDSLFSLLSYNIQSRHKYRNESGEIFPGFLSQSYMTAAASFKVINSETTPILVPFGNEGKDIINRLLASPNPSIEFALLKKAQRYSVNVFDNMIEKLKLAKALFVIPEIELFTLDERFYDFDAGIADVMTALFSANIV